MTERQLEIARTFTDKEVMANAIAKLRTLTLNKPVLAENVKIQVTGTCFNVKAYTSDKVIKTTLDEGSINIGHVQSLSLIHI